MISEKYIMNRLKDWANSPAGKKVIKKKTGLMYDGDFKYSDIKKYAEVMKEYLFTHTSAVIKSIDRNDITISRIQKLKTGGYKVNISFEEEALKRESLSEYSDGLNNIVLLFSKGYEIKDEKYVPRGDWRYKGVLVQENIRAKRRRMPHPFLENAVREFNNQTPEYIEAQLENEYQ